MIFTNPDCRECAGSGWVRGSDYHRNDPCPSCKAWVTSRFDAASANVLNRALDRRRTRLLYDRTDGVTPARAAVLEKKDAAVDAACDEMIRLLDEKPT